MKIQRQLFCPVILIIFALCIKPEDFLRGIEAGLPCKLKWDRHMNFLVRKGWSQKKRVAYVESLYNKFLESREESSCLSDDQYVKRVASKFFQHNRRLTSDYNFNRWIDSLDAFSRGEIDTSWQLPEHEELSDIEQLLSWFVSFLNAVVNSTCPYLKITWNLPNNCYSVELSESERTDCFIIKASLDEGVKCGESFFSSKDGARTVPEVEKCAKTVHREVQTWSVESKNKSEKLANLFVLALFELEESHQNKIQPVEIKPKLDLSGQLGKLCSNFDFCVCEAWHSALAHSMKLVFCLNSSLSWVACTFSSAYV